MRKNSSFMKKGLILLLAAAIIFSSAHHAFSVRATSVSDLEGQRNEVLEQIDKLKDNIDKAQDEIEKLKDEKLDIQNYISKLDKQTNALAVQITDFEKQIEQKAADIEQTKLEIEAAEQDCDKQYADMKERIRVMYENPAPTVWEMLLSSESMSDFLNRAGFVELISDYDQTLMDELVATMESIEAFKLVLEAEREELEMMQASLEQEKKKVDSSISRQKKDLKSKEGSLDAAAEDQEAYEKELAEQEKLLNQIEDQIAAAAKDSYDGEITGFIWPCPGYTRISSYFGPRPQPVPGASTNHKGVDLAAPYGTPILASAAGVVTTSKYSNSAGNYIVISHGNGVSTVYMHASRLLVSVGETVTQGQKIAEVGSTGYSSGNHLHFGVIKNGTYVDPLGYVSP